MKSLFQTPTVTRRVLSIFLLARQDSTVGRKLEKLLSRTLRIESNSVSIISSFAGTVWVIDSKERSLRYFLLISIANDDRHFNNRNENRLEAYFLLCALASTIRFQISVLFALESFSTQEICWKVLKKDFFVWHSDYFLSSSRALSSLIQFSTSLLSRFPAFSVRYAGSSIFLYIDHRRLVVGCEKTWKLFHRLSPMTREALASELRREEIKLYKLKLPMNLSRSSTLRPYVWK